jgi:hypothetical protein
MAVTPEKFVEAQYTEGFSISWEYKSPVPDLPTCLADARRLAELFKAHPTVSQLQAVRHLEPWAASGTGQITAMTTPTVIANGLVAPLAKVVTQEWMQKGVHRNVYYEDSRDRVPISFRIPKHEPAKSGSGK